MVDDDAAILKSMERALRDSGFSQVATCGDPRDALALALKVNPDVILLDLIMPHLSGEELLARLKERLPDLPVIVITAIDELASAVRCIQAGAYDYLAKPLDMDHLLVTLRRAHDVSALKRENRELKERAQARDLANPAVFASILTRSPAMASIFLYVEAIAKSREPVLIVGETGTGKELIARALHAAGECAGRLVTVNAAGLDETAFADTLFGHTRGAFTGASLPRVGLVEEAAGGVLFLDEIGDLKPDMQIKLLRLIQEHEYFPLGGDQPRRAECRIIAATNCNLRRRVRDGLFREDLFFRLYAHWIHVPPLRERPEDIPLLVEAFLDEAAKALDKGKPTPPKELFTYLSGFSFPGNVRELRAMVHDAVARHQKGVLSLRTFLDHMDRAEAQPEPGAAFRAGKGLQFEAEMPTLKEAIPLLLAEALKRCGGNQSAAARLLGISRRTMNRYITTGQIGPTPGEQDDPEDPWDKSTARPF
jgi:DNA-binding NtrC family response regulator